MATTSSTAVSLTIIDTILGDVNAIMPDFVNLVNSYRLLVGSAEELRRTAGIAPDVVARAIERTDRTGVLVDILIDLLCCKISFIGEFLAVTCAPVDLFRFLANPFDVADAPHLVAEEILLLEVLRRAQECLRGRNQPPCTPPGPPPYTFATTCFTPPPPPPPPIPPEPPFPPPCFVSCEPPPAPAEEAPPESAPAKPAGGGKSAAAKESGAEKGSAAAESAGGGKASALSTATALAKEATAGRQSGSDIQPLNETPEHSPAVTADPPPTAAAIQPQSVPASQEPLADLPSAPPVMTAARPLRPRRLSKQPPR